MKIIYFKASKVHGVYDFDLKFNEDISFLIGINGSGKTTALRLIQAALTLDFFTLFSIKFSNACVALQIDGVITEILLKNDGVKLKIVIDDIHSEVNISIPNDEERNVYAKNGRLEEYLEEQRFRFIGDAGPQIRKFLKLPRPLFLGLERRTGRYDDEFTYVDEDIDGKIRRPIHRINRGTMEGIESCQHLLETAYRKYRRISDGSNKRLLSVIVESTFDYVDFSSETLRKVCTTPACA